MTLLYATLMGTLSGMLGTGLGGALAFVGGRPSKRLTGVLLGYPAGLMMAVVAFDLIPTAVSNGSLYTAMLGFGIGVVFMAAADKALNHCHVTHNRSWLLILLGITAHNLPEGLAIGAGYASLPALGASLCLVIAMHDLPEGLSLGIPMRTAGSSYMRTVLYAALSGVPTGVGAFMGYALGVTPTALSLCIASAAGAMVYVACGEMIPASRSSAPGTLSVISLCAGFAMGLAICTYI